MIDQGRIQIFTDKVRVGTLPHIVLVAAAGQQTELTRYLWPVPAAQTDLANPKVSNNYSLPGMISEHLV